MDVSAVQREQPPLSPHSTAHSDTPVLRPGTELLGPYQDGAYDQQQYIVRRADGQLMLVSAPLYAIIARLDGRTAVSEVARAVSADLGRSVDAPLLATLIADRLAPLGLVGEHDGRPVKRARNGLLSLSLRCTLLPARATAAVGRVLAPLFTPIVVAYALVVAVGLDIWFFTTQSLTGDLLAVARSPRLMSAMIGLYLLAGLFHECGHAAGAVRGGARPGRIGAGIYVFVPAFFTDVSDSYRLDRAGRLRTDLGGVYFNVIATVLLGFAIVGTGAPLLGVAFALVQLTMLEQLLPLVRLDGYFVLGDLVGVPDLFSRVRPSVRALLPGRARPANGSGLRRGAVRLVTAWTLVVFPLLGAMSVLLLLRLPLMWRTSFHSARAEWSLAISALHHGDIAGLAVAVFALIALVVPFVGLAVLVLRAVGSGCARVMRRTS